MSGSNGPERPALDGPAPRALVVGIGNPWRGDDGVGVLVARQVEAMELPGVAVVTRAHDPVSLVATWAHMPLVLVVDAMRAGLDAGAIRRFDATTAPLTRGTFPALSSHAFGLSEVVALARAIGRLPGRLVVYGVQGVDFEPDHPVTPQVLAAAAVVTRRIRRVAATAAARELARERRIVSPNDAACPVP